MSTSARRLAVCRCGLLFGIVFASLTIFDQFGPAPRAIASDSEASPAGDLFPALGVPGLPNAFRLHERVISGGRPEGELGFGALRRLGIRTVISVDGAPPDVDEAAKQGLRYVHLPHGYDGISKRRRLELAKAVLNLPGPIYLHCHHGKHRSPAAAAVACVGAGYMTPNRGLAFLPAAGTSRDYRGLFEAVAQAEPIQGLGEVEIDFQPTVAVAPLASSMALIETSFDRLRSAESAQWNSDQDKQSWTPVQESVQLREHWTELARTPEAQSRPEDYRRLLRRSRQVTESLESLLRKSAPSPTAPQRRQLSRHLASLGEYCLDCHRQHRN